MAAVLLVEDVAIVRTILRRFLESAGHSVVECEGGDDARRAIEKSSFDVVVTDLWMKNGDGLTFITDQSRKGRAARIIAMTGGDPSASRSRSAWAAFRSASIRAASAILAALRSASRVALASAASARWRCFS